MATSKEAAPKSQGTFFDARFLGLYAGPIMSDPTTALVELVANAWDAYATKVEIDWPDREDGKVFRIKDNGCGMSARDFDMQQHAFARRELLAERRAICQLDIGDIAADERMVIPEVV